MPTLFGTGINAHADSFAAGREAATVASSKIQHNKPDLAIVFLSSNHNIDKLLEGVKSVIGDTPIFGCTSSGEFTDEKEVHGGVACALISSDTHRFYLGSGAGVVEEPKQALLSAIKRFPKHVDDYPYLSGMLLVDGLVARGDEVVNIAAHQFPSDFHFSGGAAGDDLQFKSTKILTSAAAMSDALTMCMIASKSPVIISVKHGHKPLSETFTITKSKGNIVYEINGRPAIDVWKDVLRDKMSDMDIDVDHLSEHAMRDMLLRYEAGLVTYQEYIMRHPMSVNPDGSMNFSCHIKERTPFKIMQSTPHEQIESAVQAAKTAIAKAGGMKLAGAIVFDCVCRSMILKNKFFKAIEHIRDVCGNIPVIGFETYGEIAMGVGPMSGFHHTTTVITLIPE